MNPKSIERALDRYRAFKDEDVRRLVFPLHRLLTFSTMKERSTTSTRSRSLADSRVRRTLPLG